MTNLLFRVTYIFTTTYTSDEYDDYLKVIFPLQDTKCGDDVKSIDARV